MRIFSISLILGLALLCETATSSELYQPSPAFFHEQQRGWYFYEPLPQPDPEPPPAAPKAPESEKPPKRDLALPKAFEGPDKVKIPPYEQQAKAMVLELMEKPTLAKAVAYLRWQQQQMAKAERLGMYFQHATLVEPTLKEAVLANRPTNAAGNSLAIRLNLQERDRQLAQLTDRMAILFFYLSDCPYCHESISILQSLTRKGLTIQGLSLDGLPLPGWEGRWQPDPGLAEQIGVTVTPTWVAFDASTQQVAILAVGYTAEDEILLRLEHVMDSILPRPSGLPNPSFGLAPPMKRISTDPGKMTGVDGWEVPTSVTVQWQRLFAPSAPTPRDHRRQP